MGMTMTYNDYEYTGLVFRLEQSYSTKEPRQLSASSPERLGAQKKAAAQCAAGDSAACASLAPGPNTRLAVFTERDFETRLKRYTGYGEACRLRLPPRSGAAVRPRHLQRGRSFAFDRPVVLHVPVPERVRFARRSRGQLGVVLEPLSDWNPFFTVSGSGFFLHQTFSPIWAVALDASDKLTRSSSYRANTS